MWPFRRSRPSTIAAPAPSNAPPTNAELPSWDPASRLVALVDRVRPRFDRDGVSGLNEVEHTQHVLNIVRCVFFDLDDDALALDYEPWMDYMENLGGSLLGTDQRIRPWIQRG